MKHKRANNMARSLVQMFTPYCERTPEIAGSLRREEADVNDIEIVVAPTSGTDMFDAPDWKKCPLDLAINRILSETYLLGETLKDGPRYKQFALTQEINLDLFIVRPPAQWGVIFTIRTGPESFSQWIVTQRRKGGALPSHCRVRKGAVRLKSSGVIIPMPEELDFLEFLDLGWIEPKDRRAKWTPKTK